MRTLAAALAVVLAAAPAFAHGGAYTTPPTGAGSSASPGFGGADEGGPTTRWESWWAENREDLLRIAERVDSAQALVVTPSEGGAAPRVDAAAARATSAARVREDVLPVLLGALRDDDFDVRASAAVALGKLADARATSPLQACAREDHRDEVRRAALLGLGILGRAEAIPFLSGVVADKRLASEERSMAAIALGLVGGDDAASFLSFFLERDATRPDPLNAADAQLIGSVYEALGMTRSVEALRTLWRAADDDAASPFLRAHAVVGIGRLGDHDSLERCVKLLGPATDQQLRRAAIAALGRIAGPADTEAAQALATLLATDRDPVARRFAISALGGIRTQPVRVLLRKQFGACSETERPAFALASALQGDAAAAPAIREALRAERDESARSAYCVALAILRDADSVADLERLVGPGPTPGIYRGFAALALAVIPGPASRDVLWKRLPDEQDARVWGDYAIALALLGETRVRAFLSKQLKDGEGNFEKCRAASCLGVLRRADAVPELAEIVMNRRIDGIVRSLCVVALGQIADPSPVPKLARLSACRGSAFATKALAEALTIL
jgi:HEAT repeat protein